MLLCSLSAQALQLHFLAASEVSVVEQSLGGASFFSWDLSFV